MAGRPAPVLVFEHLKPSDALLGTTAAAKELGVSPNRVRELIRKGQLPAERVGPRQYVIRRSTIERYKAAPLGRAHHPRRADGGKA